MQVLLAAWGKHNLPSTLKICKYSLLHSCVKLADEQTVDGIISGLIHTSLSTSNFQYYMLQLMTKVKRQCAGSSTVIIVTHSVRSKSAINGQMSTFRHKSFKYRFPHRKETMRVMTSARFIQFFCINK